MLSLGRRARALLIWVGEVGERLYSSARPGGARADRLLGQCRLALDPDARLRIVCRFFHVRFGEAVPERRSVYQVRGIEGGPVRTIHQGPATPFGVRRKRRNYDLSELDISDMPNRCLSAAPSWLYGITEAAVRAAGYAPAIGFLHAGEPLSVVYDLADLTEFETVVPRCVPQEQHLSRLIPAIEDMLTSGCLDRPETPEDAVNPAFVDPAPSGDEGQRWGSTHGHAAPTSDAASSPDISAPCTVPG